VTVQLPPTGTPQPQVEAQDSWRAYLELLLRWWWLLLIAALLAGGVAALISYNQTPIYRTGAKLLINQASSSSSMNLVQDMTTSGRVAQTYAQWMSQRIVIERTLAQLGLPNDPGFIAQQIPLLTATPVGDSQIIQVIIEGPNRELLVAFARALPTVFAQWVQEVQTSRYAETKESLVTRLDDLNRQIETTQNTINLLGEARDFQQQLEYNRLAEDLSRLRNNYNTLATTYETLLMTEAQSVDTIAVIEEAATPGAPVRPTPRRSIALALAVGAMIAGALIFLYELYTDRFRSSDEIRHILASPILGAINRIEKMATHSNQALIAINEPRSLSVEAFRRLRTNLRFADVDSKLHTLAVTSANPNEGKSIIAANLAVVMAQAGLKVILVDADLRKPKLHHIFELTRAPGLSDALINDTFDGLDLMLQPTAEPNLRVLSVGRKAPNPAELLGSQRMHDLLATLRDQADLVLLDTPPVLAVSDSQIIGTQVDASMIILDITQTTRRMALTAVEALDQVNARVIGIAINRVASRGRSYYYYNYYDTYEYYEQDDDDDRPGGGRAQRAPGRGKRAWSLPWRRRTVARASQPPEQQAYAATRAQPE
jgi:succinoglycan biosynthesis transport protein ExoP